MNTSLLSTVFRSALREQAHDKLCFQLQELRPGVREGSCPMGFRAVPPSRFAPFSPEKAQALQQPLPLPPSLASDASEVLCQRLNVAQLSVVYGKGRGTHSI